MTSLPAPPTSLPAPLGAKGPEGIFNLGDLKPEEAFKPSGIEEVLVINTLPWERRVIVEEPEPRGGAAPVGILDCFFNRGSGWGGSRPIPPVRRLAGTVPAMGYAFLKIATPDSADLKVGDGTIENRHYRVKVDPRTGGLLEFLDKDLGHDFAGDYHGWRPGQYIYEEVDSPEGRLAIANYRLLPIPTSSSATRDTPWRRSGATKVAVGTPSINEGRAAISLDIEAPGVRSARVTYALDAGTKALNVDWRLDKIHNTDPEAVFVAFPFRLDGKDFTIDLNGIPAKPNRDQLDGAAKDWYPLQRWVDVSDSKRGVTLVPLDAPLVHLGGITTGKWSRMLEPEGPTIMSWALNNHWLVNFKSSQGGKIPLRYRLTTHEGAVEPAAAARFAAEVAQPPVVLRDILSTAAREESFFRLANGAPIIVTAKPGEDEGWVALRLQNLSPEPADAEIAFARTPKSAKRSDPIERGGQDIRLDGGNLTVRLDPLAIETVLVRFED